MATANTLITLIAPWFTLATANTLMALWFTLATADTLTTLITLLAWLMATLTLVNHLARKAESSFVAAITVSTPVVFKTLNVLS